MLFFFLITGCEDRAPQSTPQNSTPGAKELCISVEINKSTGIAEMVEVPCPEEL